MKSRKIIPFPARKREDNYPDLIREMLQQYFPTDTWDRLQRDDYTRFRAKVLLHGLLKHLDYARRLQFTIAALQHLGHAAARDLGFKLVFEDAKPWRNAK